MSTTTFKFILPSLLAWKTALAVHIGLLLFVMVPVSLLLYHLPPKQQKWTALGMALLTVTLPPLSVATKRFAFEEIHPWMSMFLWATFGFHSFFKHMTVFFGNWPQGANDSLQTWMVWFTSLPEPLFGKSKLVQIRKGEWIQQVLVLVVKITSMSIMLSVFLHHVNPMQRVNGTSNAIMFCSCFLVDAYLHLWWIYLWASFCLDVGSFLLKSLGYTTESSFDNPLLASRNYKEFWSTRWNRPVHLFLKRVIYKPILQYWGVSSRTKHMGTIMAFLGSGLLHEYTFYIHNHIAYQPMRATMFFLLVGCCMVMEHLVMQHESVKRMVAQLPAFVISICLTIPLLPFFEHWFFRSWIQAGMLDSARELLPHLEWSYQ